MRKSVCTCLNWDGDPSFHQLALYLCTIRSGKMRRLLRSYQRVLLLFNVSVEERSLHTDRTIYFLPNSPGKFSQLPEK